MGGNVVIARRVDCDFVGALVVEEDWQVHRAVIDSFILSFDTETELSFENIPRRYSYYLAFIRLSNPTLCNDHNIRTQISLSLDAY